MPTDDLPSLENLHRRYRGKPAVQLTDAEDAEVAVSDIDEQAVFDRQADRRLRIGMAVTLTLLFVVLNAVVVTMILDAVHVDQTMLSARIITPEQRVISDRVYVSLIGGTVLQVAAIVIAIARYLFPARTHHDN